MIRSRRAGEHGQGILEFAVIFPIFIMLVFVVFDGGIMMGRYNAINHAAKEGARRAATGADATTVRAVVAGQSQGLLDATTTCDTTGDRSICVEWLDGPNTESAGQVGSEVRVTLRYRYGLKTPLANGSLLGLPITGMPSGFQMSSCALVRLERPILAAAPGGTGSC